MGEPSPINFRDKNPYYYTPKKAEPKPAEPLPALKPKPVAPNPHQPNQGPVIRDTSIAIDNNSPSDTLRSIEVKKCMDDTPTFIAKEELKEKFIRSLLDMGFTPTEAIELLKSVSSANFQENMQNLLVLPKTLEALLKTGLSKQEAIEYTIKFAKLDSNSLVIIPLLLDRGLSFEAITHLLEKVIEVTPKGYTSGAFGIVPNLIDHGLTADDIGSLIKSSIQACDGNPILEMFPCIIGLMEIGLSKDDCLEIIKFTYQNGRLREYHLDFNSLYEGTKSLKRLQQDGLLDGKTLYEILKYYKENGKTAGHGIYTVTPELVRIGYKIDDIKTLVALIKEKAGNQANLFYYDLAARLKSGEPINTILEEYNTLWDLNITWINRFSKEARAEIISNRLNPKPDGRPLAVILLPKSDYNGCFATDVEIYDELIAKGYRVMVFEEPTDKATWTALQGATSEQKASLIIWAGHGTRSSIQTSDGYSDADQLDLGDEAEMMDLNIGDSLEKGGTVLCFSCSTGKGREGNDNIGNMLARVFSNASHVWAPTEDTTMEKLIYDENDKVIGIQYGTDIAYDAHITFENQLNRLAEINPDLRHNIDETKEIMRSKTNNTLYFETLKSNKTSK